MAGKSPHLALNHFVQPLQLSISCISSSVITASGSDVKKIEALSLNRGQPVPLRCDLNLSFSFAMRYQIVKAAGQLGPFKATTRAYYYMLQENDGNEILAFHWHPNVGPKFPHMHPYSGSHIADFLVKKHIPTGRVSVEEVILFLIEEVGVGPLRQDWKDILRENYQKHEKFRTWPKSFVSS